MSLDGEAKRPIDELVLCQDVTLLDPSHLTFADLMEHFVALSRPPRTTELTKVLLGTDPTMGVRTAYCAGPQSGGPAKTGARI